MEEELISCFPKVLLSIVFSYTHFNLERVGSIVPSWTREYLKFFADEQGFYVKDGKWLRVFTHPGVFVAREIIRFSLDSGDAAIRHGCIFTEKKIIKTPHFEDRFWTEDDEVVLSKHDHLTQLILITPNGNKRLISGIETYYQFIAFRSIIYVRKQVEAQCQLIGYTKDSRRIFLVDNLPLFKEIRVDNDYLYLFFYAENQLGIYSHLGEEMARLPLPEGIIDVVAGGGYIYIIDQEQVTYFRLSK